MASEEQVQRRSSSFCSYLTCDRENLHRLWYCLLRRIGLTHLPSITRRKFEIACRTSYTSLLCVSLLYIAKPSFGPSGFLAPISSAVSASSLFFGALAGDLWKVTYSVPLCRYLSSQIRTSRSLSDLILCLFIKRLSIALRV